MYRVYSSCQFKCQLDKNSNTEPFKIEKLYRILQKCYMPKMFLFKKINENQLINRCFK